MFGYTFNLQTIFIFKYAICCSHIVEFGMVQLNKLLLFHVKFRTAIALGCRKKRIKIKPISNGIETHEQRSVAHS